MPYRSMEVKDYNLDGFLSLILKKIHLLDWSRPDFHTIKCSICAVDIKIVKKIIKMGGERLILFLNNYELYNTTQQQNTMRKIYKEVIANKEYNLIRRASKYLEKLGE